MDVAACSETSENASSRNCSQNDSSNAPSANFGWNMACEMGQKEPLVARRATPQARRGFSDSFSTLLFSHSGAKGVGYARHRNQPKEVISRCVPYHPRWYRL